MDRGKESHSRRIASNNKPVFDAGELRIAASWRFSLRKGHDHNNKKSAQHDPQRQSHRPSYELMDDHNGLSIIYRQHGFPCPLVRWHFHKEYELHLIVASSGKVFIGDYIGNFYPESCSSPAPTCPTTGSARWPKTKWCPSATCW
jgi:hypothetical protein